MLAKIGFDTAENQPSRVRYNGLTSYAYYGQGVAMVAFRFAVVFLRALGVQTLPCGTQRSSEYLRVLENVEEQVTNFVIVFEELTLDRPREVSEFARLYQLRVLAELYVDFADAVRLLLCSALCPEACFGTEEANASVLPAFDAHFLPERAYSTLL